MSVTDLALRVAAMEAILEERYSFRLVAELYDVSRASLCIWARLHREDRETLADLRNKLDPSTQPVLERLRNVRAQCGRRTRREKVPPPPEPAPALESPYVAEIGLSGTIDTLQSNRLTSRLIVNDESGLAEGAVTFALPAETVKRLRIGDRLRVIILVEREEEGGDGG